MQKNKRSIKPFFLIVLFLTLLISCAHHRMESQLKALEEQRKASLAADETIHAAEEALAAEVQRNYELQEQLAEKERALEQLKQELGAIKSNLKIREISVHSWDTLLDLNLEKENYGLYTYVLARREIGKMNRANKLFKDRLDTLLSEIINTVSKDTKFDPTETATWERNIFYIPGMKSYENSNYLDNFNSALSRIYLNRITRNIDDTTIRNRLQTHDGPFLISSHVPLRYHKDRKVSILIADLTTINPKTIPEVLNAYKIRVTTKSIEETDIFYPNILKILNFILNANEDIQIVKVALADWVK